MVAHYDRVGREIGTAERAKVYRDGLWHASAGVLLRSCDGQQIYVHRRTETKSVFAGLYDCLAGGVVAAGETPEYTAARELGEELGVITSPAAALRPLATASWTGNWESSVLRCHMFAYELHYGGPIRHEPTEIAEGAWWPEDMLRAHLADPSWPFAPDTRHLLSGVLG